MAVASRTAGVLLAAIGSLSLFAQTSETKPAVDASAPRVETSAIPFETVLRTAQQPLVAAGSAKNRLKSEGIDAAGNLAGTTGLVAVDGVTGSGVYVSSTAGMPSITTKLGATTQSGQWSVFNSGNFPLIWSEGTGATKLAIPSTFSSTYGSSTAALTFWHSTNSNYTILDVYGGSSGGNQMVKLTNGEGSSYVAMLGLYQNGVVRSVLSASSTTPSYFLGNVAVGKNSVGSGVAFDVAGTLHADTITATNGITAVYQDLAEWVPASETVDAGTVVVVSPDATNEVSPSTRAYQTSVAGVVSDKPGVLLGKPGQDKAKIATTGRVRVKVDASRGAILPGDLLVTSDKRGVAMKSQPVSVGGMEIHRPGTLVGKALEPLASGEGEILVLLSLQ